MMLLRDTFFRHKSSSIYRKRTTIMKLLLLPLLLTSLYINAPAASATAVASIFGQNAFMPKATASGVSETAMVTEANGQPQPAPVFASAPEVVARGFRFTEGPYWHPDRYLLFSDIPANTVYRWTPGSDSAHVYLSPSGNSNGIKALSDGSLVLAQHAGRVSRLNPDGTLTTLADNYQGRRLNSPNDIAVRRDGRIYFTDPSFGVAPADRQLDYCGVFSMGPTGEGLQLHYDQFALPNGIAFSPAEDFLYVNDSATGTILRFAVAADGSLGEPVQFANIGARGRLGGADGMVTDALGRLFTTGPNGLIVFDADGNQLQQLVFEHQITNLAWGESDAESGLRDLYITAPNTVLRIKVRL
jgi:gluconolactonase